MPPLHQQLVSRLGSLDRRSSTLDHMGFTDVQVPRDISVLHKAPLQQPLRHGCVQTAVPLVSESSSLPLANNVRASNGRPRHDSYLSKQSREELPVEQSNDENEVHPALRETAQFLEIKCQWKLLDSGG